MPTPAVFKAGVRRRSHSKPSLNSKVTPPTKQAALSPEPHIPQTIMFLDTETLMPLKKPRRKLHNPSSFSLAEESERETAETEVFADQEVLMIGCLLCFFSDNKVVPVKRLLFTQPHMIEGSEISSMNDIASEIDIFHSHNEKSLLLSFIAVFNELNVSLVSSYNIVNFDFENFHNRCSKHHIKESLRISSTFSPCNNLVVQSWIEFVSH
ncbi:hypothetical protein RCL1_008176 [Eukaryota sp. TZLM3-RCL]